MNSVGDSENQCVAGGGHQRSPLQTYSEIDLTQNPIKVIVTGDITVSAELDGIGLTIGEYTYGGNQWEYGYSSAEFADGKVYGSIEPNIFKGSKITSLAVGQSVDPSSQMILLHILWISFSIGLSQSTIKLTINNSTYTLNPVEGNTYYYIELPTNDSSLILWMQSQVGKTIPVIIQ